MNLEPRIRDLFPPAHRDRRQGIHWDVTNTTDKLLALVIESNTPLILSIVIENDQSVLTYGTCDESPYSVRFDDRYAYALRLIMAHLSLRLNELEAKQLSPYEGSGKLSVDGHTIEIDFNNKLGQTCLQLKPITSTRRLERELATVA